MNRWPDTERDRGSMLLALMMLVVLAGVATMLTVSTVAQSKATQHDSRYTTVLPAADAGIARGVFMLNHGQSASIPTSDATALTIDQGSQSAKWYATPQYSTTAPTSYLLTAKTTTGVERTLKAEAYQSSRFPVAAFADKSIVFRGGNTATSYNSTTGTTSTTGHGRLGSNGSVTLDGSAIADGVDLYNWTSDPNSSRCSGSTCTSTGGLNTYGTKLDITSASATQFITSQLNNCTSTTAFTTSTTSTHALPSGTWCASSLNLDVDTTVTADTVIYVSGNVTMSHHLNINYSSTTVPVPSKLQIYMLGTTYDQSNHTTIAGAIYAPLATCNGGAQSVVYGSLVCGSISNVGGWQFHYDDALATVGGGDFRVRNYREG